MIKLFNYFLLICLSMFAACGGGGGNGTATETTAEVTVDEMLEAEAVVVENEVVERQFFGQNGNLWKPSGDDHGAGAGNLVVLLSSQFKEQFDSCEVVDRDG
ncbi:MAG: hypothetical protein KDD56_01725, partial [Bdellovibrionales bacterium]|nr:hypothetical protein [Bdellovibrionales bacterium]